MTRTTWITLVLSVAACSSSTSPATPADYEDTAQAIAASTAPRGRGGEGRGGGDGRGDGDGGDVVAMADALSLARGRLPTGALGLGGGRFRCNRMGIDNDFVVTCKDAAGAVQAQCDRTTDSATVEVSWKGNFETPNVTASVDREGSWTITGLQSPTASLSGDSSFSLDTTMTSLFHEGVTSTFTFDTSADYDAIQIETEKHRITGGSASFEVKAHRTVTGTAMGAKDVDKSFEVHADLTFNADRTATLVLDGTERFTIDLATGKVTREGAVPPPA